MIEHEDGSEGINPPRPGGVRLGVATQASKPRKKRDSIKQARDEFSGIMTSLDDKVDHVRAEVNVLKGQVVGLMIIAGGAAFGVLYLLGQ